jgi:hypothetical protein
MKKTEHAHNYGKLTGGQHEESGTLNYTKLAGGQHEEKGKQAKGGGERDRREELKSGH